MRNPWSQDGNLVAILEPGPRDLFVVTMIDGKQILAEQISEFDTAHKRARRIAAAHEGKCKPFTVKVVSMSLEELLAFQGIEYAAFAEHIQNSMSDEEARKMCAESFFSVLRDSDDQRIREQALEGLKTLGVMQ